MTVTAVITLMGFGITLTMSVMAIAGLALSNEAGRVLIGSQWNGIPKHRKRLQQNHQHHR